MLIGYIIDNVQIYFHNFLKLRKMIFIFLLKGLLELERQKHFPQ
jgi:hypothetical protein